MVPYDKKESKGEKSLFESAVSRDFPGETMAVVEGEKGKGEKEASS